MTSETKAILAEMNAAADRLADTANRAKAQADALKADTPRIVAMATGDTTPMQETPELKFRKPPPPLGCKPERKRARNPYPRGMTFGDLRKRQGQ